MIWPMCYLQPVAWPVRRPERGYQSAVNAALQAILHVSWLSHSLSEVLPTRVASSFGAHLNRLRAAHGPVNVTAQMHHYSGNVSKTGHSVYLPWSLKLYP